MSSLHEHNQADSLEDWISFIKYFASQCHKYVEAEGKAFIGFWVPCACCSYEDGIALHPKTGKQLIFANLSEPDELWVDLWAGSDSVVSFTIEENLAVTEDTFGSAVHPDPHTPLGILLNESDCFYEHAAIRLIPFLATVLKVNARQAADVFADWQMDFD